MTQTSDSGLKPTTIPDEGVPALGVSEINRNTSSSEATAGKIINEAIEPKKIPDASTTKSTIAREVVSIVLDTIRRRINGMIRIGQVGGIGDVNGNPIADYIGLNSLNQFPTNTIAATGQSTSSNSYVDITSVTLTFALPRAASVLVLVNVTTNGADSITALNVDTVNQADTIKIGGLGGGATGSSSFLLNLAKGSHTIKLQIVSPTAANVNIERASITYVSLGK